MPIDTPSSEVPTLVRVEPGDPQASYFYQTISEAKPKVGAQMPRNGDPLTVAEQSLIRVWILQGAR